MRMNLDSDNKFSNRFGIYFQMGLQIENKTTLNLVFNRPKTDKQYFVENGNFTYIVALRSVRRDILVTGCTTAKNRSKDIRTSVYTLAWHVTTIMYCTYKINYICF